MSEQIETLNVAVARETCPGENRVALVPATVAALIKKKMSVTVQSGAGEAAGFPDNAYLQAGAKIESNRDALFAAAQVILQVRAAGANPDAANDDLGRFQPNQIVIAHCDPLWAPQPLQGLAEKNVTSFSLELLPRITRAQSMDVLSSMATIAGYKAVLLAADALPRMFPMLMTAAGTLKPARILVVGAGVAGLQAIATAKRLGAVVFGYDIRPAVKEQVESLGGKFVELDLDTGTSEQKGGYAKEMGEEFYRRQRELMGEVVAGCDAVITTAAIPGRKSPVLITTEMVEGMAPGSVVVDLAAERGGNCELSCAGETTENNGVKIIAPVNLPSSIPYHASEMYAKNISTFLLNLISDEKINIDLSDEIIRDTLVTRDGTIVNNRVRAALGLEELATDAAVETSA